MIRYRVWLLALLLMDLPLWAQPTAKPPASQLASPGLRHQIREIARLSQGRVGVAATVLETGESMGWHDQERFPMQSVYKLPIGMAVLRQVDQKKLALLQLIHVSSSAYLSTRQHSPLRDQYPQGTDVTVAELLRYTVSESDGSASDVLLHLVGGPLAVMNFLQTIGITGVVVANTEKEIGSDNAVQYRNWATPAQMTRLLRAVQQGNGLSASGRGLLLRLMTDTPTGLRRLKGALPANTVVAHKTGTSWTVDGVTAATNDAGIITLPDGRHLAMAVFVADAHADERTREAVIAGITKAVWTALQ